MLLGLRYSASDSYNKMGTRAGVLGLQRTRTEQQPYLLTQQLYTKLSQSGRIIFYYKTLCSPFTIISTLLDYIVFFAGFNTFACMPLLPIIITVGSSGTVHYFNPFFCAPSEHVKYYSLIILLYCILLLFAIFGLCSIYYQAAELKRQIQSGDVISHWCKGSLPPTYIPLPVTANTLSYFIIGFKSVSTLRLSLLCWQCLASLSEC